MRAFSRSEFSRAFLKAVSSATMAGILSVKHLVDPVAVLPGDFPNRSLNCSMITERRSISTSLMLPRLPVATGSFSVSSSYRMRAPGDLALEAGEELVAGGAVPDQADGRGGLSLGGV